MIKRAGETFHQINKLAGLTIPLNGLILINPKHLLNAQKTAITQPVLS